MSAAAPARVRAALAESASTAGLGLRALSTLAGAGVLAPVRPDRLVRMLAAWRTLGATPATMCAVNAARHPHRRALVDDRGTLTFGQLDRRTTALAAALHGDFGVGPGHTVGVMCRNHRGFVEATLAASRLGADLVFLNTEFPGPQLAPALAREGVDLVVHDQEFETRLSEAAFDGHRVIAWHDQDPGRVTLEALIARGGNEPPAPGRPGRIVLLTSGTTGVPKGAPRSPSTRAAMAPVSTVVSRMGLRSGEPILVAPPLFHGFGLAFFMLALFLGSPMVVHRRFDAQATLAAIAEHRVTCVVAVPVMFQRILGLPEDVRRHYDISCLRTAMSAAAPLSPALAGALTDAFGQILFNGYGSSETGIGTIAGPADLRAAPGTVGYPPPGVTVRILDAEGQEVPRGMTGRIFIGSDLVFTGYSGGGSKQVIDGLMSTGDLGRLDARGRLFVDGREDDMIVSGGENVFPQEVEDTLARHEGVTDVVVLGVDDDQFGQRLKAFVVVKPGAQVSADELKAYVKARLARYKIPRDVVFLDEIPRNPAGKILRGRLRER